MFPLNGHFPSFAAARRVYRSISMHPPCARTGLLHGRRGRSKLACSCVWDSASFSNKPDTTGLSIVISHEWNLCVSARKSTNKKMHLFKHRISGDHLLRGEDGDWLPRVYADIESRLAVHSASQFLKQLVDLGCKRKDLLYSLVWIGPYGEQAHREWRSEQRKSKTPADKFMDGQVEAWARAVRSPDRRT